MFTKRKYMDVRIQMTDITPLGIGCRTPIMIGYLIMFEMTGIVCFISINVMIKL